MVITKDYLDMRICDVEKNPTITNTQTYREFIRESEEEFDLISKDLDEMPDKHFVEYMDFLDYLWTK